MSADLTNETSGVGFAVGPACPTSLEDEWAEWLGSIRMEELAESNLAVEATLPSNNPSVLDLESAEVERIANNALMGLLLAKSFSAIATPTLVVGGRWATRSSVRTVASLPQPVHESPAISAEIQQMDLNVAARLGTKLTQLSRSKPWRFNRSLHLYRQARCERDALERLHQYVRTMEGLTKPPNKNGTTVNFVRRMADLAGQQHEPLFRRIYELRGAIEHLREHEILSDCTRQARLNLVRDGHFAEYISRALLSRVIDDERLWPHFATAEAVDDFWSRDEVERRQIWGAPINIDLAVDGFDPLMLSDADLGLKA
jgi:hypothetical protein